MHLNDILAYFTLYGYHHLVDIDKREARSIDSSSELFKIMTKSFQETFAHDYKIEPDGVIGPVTLKMMREPRCNCPDIEPNFQAARWPEECSRSLKVHANLKGINDSNVPLNQMQQIWYRGFRESERVCNFHAEPVFNVEDSHYHCYAKWLFGGTLAWSEYPSSCGGRSESAFDSDRSWSENLITDTALHEQGHGLGMPHGPSGSVMFWTINRNHNGTWKSWDIKQLVSRYGEPVGPVPNPDPNPTPPPEPDPNPTPPPNIPDGIFERILDILLDLFDECAISNRQLLEKSLRENEKVIKLVVMAAIKKGLSDKEYREYGKALYKSLTNELSSLTPKDMDILIRKLK